MRNKKEDSRSSLMTVPTLSIQSDPRLGEVWLDCKQVAARIHTTPECLAVWRCQGLYPGLKWVRRGRRILYKLSDVNRFMETCEYGSPRQPAAV